MGEIAEDIAEGFQCSWCGVCFESAHGFPVVCRECHEAHKLDHQNGDCKCPKKTRPVLATNKEL